MRYLIGIDVGTTNMKVLIFDCDGNPVAQSSCASKAHIYDAGQATYDPDEIWTTICSLLQNAVRELVDRYGERVSGDIAGLSVSGMGEAGVPLDKEGNALYPIIAWYDKRTIPFLDHWCESFNQQKLFDITALKNQHIFTANKLLWLRDHEPDIFKRMYRWHCVPDYISYKLTGESAIDLSLASRTLLMDNRKRDWSEELLRFIGVRKSIMPRIVPSGEEIGKITGDVAKILGLPSGLPVFAGGHDHICGALACGVFSEGAILDSSGTAEEVLTAIDNIDMIYKLSETGFNAGHHVVPDWYYLAGGIPASGASVDWFKRELSRSADSNSSCPGAKGLFFLPHLRGSSSPDRNQLSKGAFIGIKDYHCNADFMQAVYEGICYEMRLSVESILNGRRAKRVVSIGGGTKNPDWLQIKSNVLGLTVEVPAVQESTALGAALLAGIGCGLYPNAFEAYSRTYRVGQLISPESDAVSVYNQQFPLFKELYPHLLAINQKIN